jgi:hypothetical protein
MVVDRRRQQIVGKRDGVEVAGEMKVDVLHRHDLRITAACRAALHSEHRSERRLANADRRLLAEAVERVAQSNGSRCLPLAGRRGTDARDENQPGVFPSFERVQVLERNLRLVVAVGFQMLFANAEFFPRHR